MVRDDIRLGHNTSRRVLWAPPTPTPALLDKKVNVHKGHTKEPKSSWVLGFCSHHSRLQILFPHLGPVLNPRRIFPHEFNMTDEACSRGSAAAYGQESVRVSGTGWRRATRLLFVSFFKSRSYTCGTMLTRAGRVRPLESRQHLPEWYSGYLFECSSLPCLTMAFLGFRYFISSTKASVTSTNEPVTLEKETGGRIINLSASSFPSL
ncbi:uncharacterized protein LOC131513749 isoform X1 [Neofelis nebulosa]|uniref:uncharacterized protein LOC131513749 isoform X1 n=1 Tax=Neofelis nebulosa TaxID=61452 RepID=UPI00272BA4A6|nr:uncharacterized protein LOC131513749 isoform X1 [Neofelis nebulosa]